MQTHFSAALDLKYVIGHYKKTLVMYSYIWDSLAVESLVSRQSWVSKQVLYNFSNQGSILSITISQLINWVHC